VSHWLLGLALVVAGGGASKLAAQAPTVEPPRLEPSLQRPAEPQPPRVLIVRDPEATTAFKPRREIVRGLVDQGLTNYTGTAAVADAWRSLVSTQDVVGVKVYSGPGPLSGTRPEVTEAVVAGLLSAGLQGTNIIIWDKYAIDLAAAGYRELADGLGVRLASSAGAGYDDEHAYEAALLAQLVYGDHEFGRKGERVGRRSFVSKLLSQELTKIINISPLLNHRVAGVTGALYTMAIGSVDNTLRFETEPGRLLEAVPDIYALPLVGERVALHIVDALVCQYEGSQRSLLHYAVPLNELRFSQDPVALDSLSLRDLDQLRLNKSASWTNSIELYRNASLLELGVSDLRRVQIDRLP
jgi:hypothetical protein